MPVAIYQVDAFTDVPFSGNPAGVCLVTEDLEAGWAQAVAREMQVSETAFVRPVPGAFEIRWFSPESEVELCGHATLAAAHVLWEGRMVGPGTPIAFRTKSRGVLLCECEEEGGPIAMDFPADPPERAALPPGLAEALGTERVEDTARGRYDWLVELPDADAVRGVRPDFEALRRFETRGVAVTARGDDGRTDIVSRFSVRRWGWTRIRPRGRCIARLGLTGRRSWGWIICGRPSFHGAAPE